VVYPAAHLSHEWRGPGLRRQAVLKKGGTMRPTLKLKKYKKYKMAIGPRPYNTEYYIMMIIITIKLHNHYTT
jgi:hypothetical protein